MFVTTNELIMRAFYTVTLLQYVFLFSFVFLFVNRVNNNFVNFCFI